LGLWSQEQQLESHSSGSVCGRKGGECKLKLEGGCVDEVVVVVVVVVVW
jgi:hypothetical protein